MLALITTQESILQCILIVAKHESLEPTQRGLGSSEKYMRSRQAGTVLMQPETISYLNCMVDNLPLLRLSIE